MLFEALRDGQVTLETRFDVSAQAAAMAATGSTMFLDERDRPTVEQLIQGIIVLSGNDACVAVAEGLAGTEAEFAEQDDRAGQDAGPDRLAFRQCQRLARPRAADERCMTWPGWRCI